MRTFSALLIACLAASSVFAQNPTSRHKAAPVAPPKHFLKGDFDAHPEQALLTEAFLAETRQWMLDADDALASRDLDRSLSVADRIVHRIDTLKLGTTGEVMIGTAIPLWYLDRVSVLHFSIYPRRKAYAGLIDGEACEAALHSALDAGKAPATLYECEGVRQPHAQRTRP